MSENLTLMIRFWELVNQKWANNTRTAFCVEAFTIAFVTPSLWIPSCCLTTLSPLLVKPLSKYGSVLPCRHIVSIKYYFLQWWLGSMETRRGMSSLDKYNCVFSPSILPLFNETCSCVDCHRLMYHIPIGLKVLQDVSPTLVAVLVKGGAHHLDLRYVLSFLKLLL